MEELEDFLYENGFDLGQCVILVALSATNLSEDISNVEMAQQFLKNLGYVVNSGEPEIDLDELGQTIKEIG